jgi:hypothetical protein
MSLALDTRPATVTPLRRVEAPAPAAPRIRAVPEGTEARGFVLYVGIDEAKAVADGTSLARIVEQMKALAAEIAPSSETYAAVALAPREAGGRDVDVVRLALQDPAALAKQRAETAEENPDRARDGVVIDLSRKRVLLDNEQAGLTYCLDAWQGVASSIVAAGHASGAFPSGDPEHVGLVLFALIDATNAYSRVAYRTDAERSALIRTAVASALGLAPGAL